MALAFTAIIGKATLLLLAAWVAAITCSELAGTPPCPSTNASCKHEWCFLRLPHVHDQTPELWLLVDIQALCPFRVTSVSCQSFEFLATVKIVSGLLNYLKQFREVLIINYQWRGNENFYLADLVTIIDWNIWPLTGWPIFSQVRLSVDQTVLNLRENMSCRYWHSASIWRLIFCLYVAPKTLQCNLWFILYPKVNRGG